MTSSDPRWVEVSRSEYSHEREGLAYIKDRLPVAPPYRAWTNFDFMDSHGRWHEIDALVLGRVAAVGQAVTPARTRTSGVDLAEYLHAQVDSWSDALGMPRADLTGWGPPPPVRGLRAVTGPAARKPRT